MDKIRWFSRISIWMIPIFVFCNILVKLIIWPSASSVIHAKIKIIHPITLFKSTPYVKRKFTTEQKQKLFNSVDHLLTPAFILLFVNIAMRIIKTPGIFEEKD